MSIAKTFKDIINKLHKSSKPEPPEWKVQYDKTPVHTETVSARVTMNAMELRYRPDDYVGNCIAAMIANELLRCGLITIEQPDVERPDERVFIGKIEVVSRR